MSLDYINRVTYRGEHFIVLRGKKPVAEISPVPTGRTLSESKHILESLPQLTPEELSELENDLAAIRQERR